MPSVHVKSMNAVVIEAQATLEDASAADTVIVGSGMQTPEVARKCRPPVKAQAGPCTATDCCTVLRHADTGQARLAGWRDGVYRPDNQAWLEEAGIRVLERPFFANGNLATAGGCLAAQYLAAWLIARVEGIKAARSALHYVAPVGEKDVSLPQGTVRTGRDTFILNE